jgi:hypothetical protein
VLSVGVLGGCSSPSTGPGGWAGGEGEFTRTARAQTPWSEPVTLLVSTRNGSIEVNEGGDDEVRVFAELRSDARDRLEAAYISIEEMADGTVEITAEWPGGWSSQWEDRANLVVTLPGAASAELTAENGSVRATGLSGPLLIDTRNGEVRVRDHAGPVRLSTASGAIDVRGVTGAVVASTSNGDITLDIPGATGPIDAQTSNGTADITLGSPFRGVIPLTTSNGGVETSRVERAGGAVISLTPRSATAKFGGVDQPTSTVRTSNGRVVLRGE